MFLAQGVCERRKRTQEPPKLAGTVDDVEYARTPEPAAHSADEPVAERTAQSAPTYSNGEVPAAGPVEEPAEATKSAPSVLAPSAEDASEAAPPAPPVLRYSIDFIMSLRPAPAARTEQKPPLAESAEPAPSTSAGATDEATDAPARVHGRVVSMKGGFGFLRTPGLKRDLFFHSRSVDAPHGINDLCLGMEVEFEPHAAPGSGKPSAVHVKPVAEPARTSSGHPPLPPSKSGEAPRPRQRSMSDDATPTRIRRRRNSEPSARAGVEAEGRRPLFHASAIRHGVHHDANVVRVSYARGPDGTKGFRMQRSWRIVH